MKKLVSLLLTVVMIASLTACGQTEESTENTSETVVEVTEEGTTEVTEEATSVMPSVAKEDIKVGVIHITDPAEGSGYTYTHDQGIVAMQTALGLDDSQIIRKNNVNDGDATAIENAMRECIEEGCNIIFATSWGYMDTCEALAEEFPEVVFSHGTGYKSNGVNFNAKRNYSGVITVRATVNGVIQTREISKEKINAAYEKSLKSYIL